MATLYPFSNSTTRLLSTWPEPGTTHRWLAQVASRLRHTLTPERCEEFLRAVCARIQHRHIEEREIQGAVAFAYAEISYRPSCGQVRGIEWPRPCEAVRASLAAVPPLFGPDGDLGITSRDVLPGLFRADELICSGPDARSAMVRPLADTLADAHLQQFIVPNPMAGQWAETADGRQAQRCKANVRRRRFLVAEFDQAGRDEQVRALAVLARYAPLVLAVNSGGKSIHGWLYVEQLPASMHARIFALACSLGADPSRWDPAGWVRMPGGWRPEKQARQTIMYWTGGVR